jgi:hypothetical protein
MSTTIRYTTTDLPSLPDDGRRYKIIDGDLYVSRQPRRRGVTEYWILDWSARQVEVYERRGETLELARTLSGNDELTSPLLAGFRCPVGKLFDAVTRDV